MDAIIFCFLESLSSVLFSLSFLFLFLPVLEGVLMLFSYFGSLVRAFVCWKKCVIFSIKFFVDNLVIVLLDIHLVKMEFVN